MSKAQLVREQKLVVVGSGGVGKSALTIQYVSAQFIDDEYNPTIEDAYRCQRLIDGEAVQLDILDTAGQEEYSAMQDQWYKYGMGFLLVYSITDRRSFEAIDALHRGILRTKDRDSVPCVIASNKCDLERHRRVGQLEGRDLAKRLSAPFIECSAREAINVDVAFRELIRLIRKDQKKAQRIALNATRALATAQAPLEKPLAARKAKSKTPTGCCVVM